MGLSTRPTLPRLQTHPSAPKPGSTFFQGIADIPRGSPLLGLSKCFPGSLRRSEVKVAQWCPTLCDPMDYTVQGILQARILEWVTFTFSRGSSQPRDLNPGLTHCGPIPYQLSHQGSPGSLWLRGKKVPALWGADPLEKEIVN